MIQTLCPFREDLVSMPIRSQHDGRDRSDVLVRDSVLEKVTHAIDEHSLWCRPPKRFKKFFRDQTRRESTFIGMTGHAAEPLRECLGIAVLAAGTYFEASTNGVPG